MVEPSHTFGRMLQVEELQVVVSSLLILIGPISEFDIDIAVKYVCVGYFPMTLNTLSTSLCGVSCFYSLTLCKDGRLHSKACSPYELSIYV